MPPAMTDLLDIWAAHSPLAGHALDQITVDFLLPTGIYIQMDVPREATIQHIKLVSGGGGVTFYLFVVLTYYSPVGEKHRLHPTITQLVRHYLMPVLTGVTVVAGWVYLVFRPPPALGVQTAHDIIRVCS